MGYNAFVLCNCYKEGKTVEPPHKQYVYFDKADGYGWDIDFPNEMENAIATQMWEDFEDWKNTACPHPYMNVADEYLANISGMAKFRSLVEEYNTDNQLSTLKTYLPTLNGGILPASHTSQAYHELELLESIPTTSLHTQLYAVATNKKLVSCNKLGTALIGLTQQHTLGVANGHFYITERDVLKFTSTHFTQETIDEHHYKFTDLATSQVFICSMGINRQSELQEFIIKFADVLIKEEYAYIIEPLKKLCLGAIEMNNPIQWA